MPTKLDEILAVARDVGAALRADRDALERAAQAAPIPPPFADALRRPTLALIAEVKRRSPSAGAIREGLDASAHAERYARAGAAAVSVLTEAQFFGGSLGDLAAVSTAVAIPTLRKDFILFEEQILEARIAGASAVLLIVRALSPVRLPELIGYAAALDLAALVEVHDGRELHAALDAGATTIGVNSRNLDTFAIDTAAAWALLPQIPAFCVAVAESGMANAGDAADAADAGADAVLLGTALSAAADPASIIADLIRVPRHGR